MKKAYLHSFLAFAIFFLTSTIGYSQEYVPYDSGNSSKTLSGSVRKDDFNKHGQNPTGYVIDALSGKPVAGAVVSVPDKGISVMTGNDGSFRLDKGLSGNAILSVKKDGYLPFSLNAKLDGLSAPFNLNIEQLQGQVVIDEDIHHLGDNNYSAISANAASFRLPSEGPTFIKPFYIENIPKNGLVLKIGSIIGLDTYAAFQHGQTQITTYSSPTSIFLNSVKIAELALNADNKIIPIPKQYLKPHTENLIVIQTGVNQAGLSTGLMDYDDIEFMNVIVEEVK